MKWFFFLLLPQFIFAQENFNIKDIRLTQKISCTDVKDQAMSSTCWSFAGNSFLETEMIRKGIPVVDLSEMYIARFSYYNKIEEHLQQKGNTFFTPGGQFHDIIKVIKRFGLVPEAVYMGKKDIASTHDHSQLDMVIKYYVKNLVANGITSLGKQQSRFLDSVFDAFLGVVPRTFYFQGKAYTPLNFAKNVIRLNMNDYVEITSYNHHPMYTGVVLEDPYNWSKDKYFNVPFADFMAITNYALDHQYSICWDGDVTETGFDFWNSTVMLEKKIPNLENYRNRTFLDSISTIDHMMHIVGYGKDHYKNKWYYVKNSWGNSNAAKGYLYMDTDYFAIKTVAIIVHKNAIPVTIRKKMGL